MPYLGDYLGHLMAELAIARMAADLETVRLAELYAAHPLMRSMPVPHLRLPDVDVDLPVLIESVEEVAPGAPVRGGVPIRDLRSRFDQLLTDHLGRQGKTLTQAQQQTLSDELERRAAAVSVPGDLAVDVFRVADEFTAASARVVEGTAAPAVGETTALSAQLRAAARLEFLKLRPPPPRLRVAVTSAQIRELGTDNNVTRLRLKITEQGMEWTSVESADGRSERLIPE
jgi:hypothetical protein